MTTNQRSTSPTIPLRDGRGIPQLGYGVWQVAQEIAAERVRVALETGYRLIDTAMIYQNERGVGTAIRASSIPRSELFVTTKLWNSEQDDPPGAIARSLERLGLEYVDLYLIHWPAPQQGLFVEAWRALIKLREAGHARSVGVSNFALEHLNRIAQETGELPVINQIELHPYFQQRELRAFHDEHGIVTQAWSPLGQGGSLLADAVIGRIAQTHGRTPAQVVLRWHLQIGNVTIPKSADAGRIAENFDVFDFELDPAQLGQIAELDRNDGRIGPDPALATF